MNSSTIRAGDWVRVRTKEEILASLDEGRMPRRACLSCRKCLSSAARGYGSSRGRTRRVIPRTVSAAGACSGLCTWRMSAARAQRTATARPGAFSSGKRRGLSVKAIPDRKSPGLRPAARNRTSRFEPSPTVNTQAEPNHRVMRASPRCWPRATEPLRWWDLRQYIEDYTSGNAMPVEDSGGIVLFPLPPVGFLRNRNWVGSSMGIRHRAGMARPAAIPHPLGQNHAWRPNSVRQAWRSAR